MCGFCGRPSSHLTTLSIEGNHIDFCDECLTLCLEISEEYNSKCVANVAEEVEPENKPLTLPKPAEIKAELDKYVIGQDEAKITLSVALIAVHNSVHNVEIHNLASVASAFRAADEVGSKTANRRRSQLKCRFYDFSRL